MNVYNKVYAKVTESDRQNRISTLPMMSWADYDLLQELHKAHNSAISPQCRGDEVPMTLPLAEDVKTRAELNILEMGRMLRRGERAIAQLQDQIKDWEAKCKHLEDTNAGMAKTIRTLIELKNKYFNENRRLSKSLQHYRNAFFSDQIDSGGTIPCPPVIAQPGGSKP